MKSAERVEEGQYTPKKWSRLCYSFMRPHMTLGNKTLLQVTGINTANEENEWREVLRRALTETDC